MRAVRLIRGRPVDAVVLIEVRREVRHAIREWAQDRRRIRRRSSQVVAEQSHRRAASRSSRHEVRVVRGTRDGDRLREVRLGPLEIDRVRLRSAAVDHTLAEVLSEMAIREAGPHQRLCDGRVVRRCRAEYGLAARHRILRGPTRAL